MLINRETKKFTLIQRENMKKYPVGPYLMAFIVFVVLGSCESCRSALFYRGEGLFFSFYHKDFHSFIPLFKAVVEIISKLFV